MIVRDDLHAKWNCLSAVGQKMTVSETTWEMEKVTIIIIRERCKNDC